eukprot:TRINITY_DN11969_c0_g1_i1.p1 TRINITY_DN11969_c0_g1~~TRINITY_DN11969_c0_g1_i1.p1  ORF type:complete len:560 (+),score=83.98 TRINITY_DN11969_c0_g1_i1:24-1682(+)
MDREGIARLWEQRQGRPLDASQSNAVQRLTVRDAAHIWELIEGEGNWLAKLEEVRAHALRPQLPMVDWAAAHMQLVQQEEENRWVLEDDQVTEQESLLSAMMNQLTAVIRNPVATPVATSTGLTDAARTPQFELVSESLMHRAVALFKEFDVDNSGFLDPTELSELLTVLGYTQSFETAVRGMHVRNGTLGFYSFVHWLGPNASFFPAHAGLPPGAAMASGVSALSTGFHLFQLYDTNRSGMLDETELEALLLDIGVAASAENMLQQYDKDRNGTIEFHEFMFWLMQTLPTSREEYCGADEASLKDALISTFDLYTRASAKRGATISRTEYDRVLLGRATGLNLPNWEEVDVNGDGAVSFKELFRIVLSRQKTTFVPSPTGSVYPGTNIPLGALESTADGLLLCGTLLCYVISASNLPKMDILSKADAFVEVRPLSRRNLARCMARTPTVRNTVSPAFGHMIRFDVEWPIDKIEFWIFDDNRIMKRKFIGKVVVEIAEILQTPEVRLAKRLLPEEGKHPARTDLGLLSVAISFHHKHTDFDSYQQWVRSTQF